MVSHHSLARLGLILVMLVFALPRPAAAQGSDVAAGPDATATVLAAGGKLVSGSAVANLPIQVINVEKLGAATVLVGFDPALLSATGCQRNASFDVGLCNRSVDRNGDGKADAVLFNVVSLAGMSAGAAPLTLATITWQAVGAVTNDTLTTLGVQVQTFADVSGNPLAHVAQDGAVVVRPPPPVFRTYLPLLRR